MNKKLTLTKKLLGLLYWCVLECMSRVDRNTPVGRTEDLQSLELKLSKLLINKGIK